VFCSRCGAGFENNSRFCKVCGSPVGMAGVPPVVAGSLGPQQTGGKAIASLVCGCFSFSVLTAIPAVVLGHLSLSEIRKSAGRLRGEGLAIAGLVLGYLGLVCIPFILIIAAIAIPNLLRARMAANESSAVSAIRTLNAAQISYSSLQPKAGFTCELSDLSRAGLIESDVAGGSRSGYITKLLNCTADSPGGANVKYQVVAYPMTKGQSGNRAFCSDESAVIRVDADGSAQACLESGAVLQ
jgi:type IV pilus assembly protein PilA